METVGLQASGTANTVSHKGATGSFSGVGQWFSDLGSRISEIVSDIFSWIGSWFSCCGSDSAVDAENGAFAQRVTVGRPDNLETATIGAVTEAPPKKAEPVTFPAERRQLKRLERQVELLERRLKEIGQELDRLRPPSTYQISQLLENGASMDELLDATRVGPKKERLKSDQIHIQRNLSSAREALESFKLHFGDLLKL